MILAGDVGATKTHLGLYLSREGRPRPVREEVFSSREAPSLRSILEEFLSRERDEVRRCAFGVAGPVVDGRSRVTNLGWEVRERELARDLRLSRVDVLNDVEAMGWEIPHLTSQDLLDLTPELSSRPGNAAVLAAGTGLGMSILHWDGRRHVPNASEGGHQGFAPRTDDEIALLQHLRTTHGRVSVERVVSGPGLVAIYESLVRSGRARSSAEAQRRIAMAGDRSEAIAEECRDGDRAAACALEVFLSLYGAAAGDFALAARATAGVYIGGGIAPKLLPCLRDGAFLRGFRDKGRLSPLVSAIPVRVILEPRTALRGAAAYAAGPEALWRPPRFSGDLRVNTSPDTAGLRDS
jgi:glucokinase